MERYKDLIFSLIDNSSDTVAFCIDKNYRLVTYNSDFTNFVNSNYGKNAEDGMYIFDLFIDNKVIENQKINLGKVLSGESFSVIGDILGNSNKLLYEYVYKPVLNPEKEVIGAVVFYSDITQRKKLNKTWGALIRITEKIHLTKSVEELIHEIYHEISGLIDTTNFFVALYDESNDIYHFPFYKDQYDDLDYIEPQALKKSMTDYIRRIGEPRLFGQKQFENLIKQGEVQLIGTQSLSWLGVPLKVGNKTIGVMVVQSYSMENLYSEKDLELMAFVSEHVATAVQRKRFEQELQLTAERLKIAQSIALIGHWEADLSTQKIYASEEALKIIGLEKGNIVDINFVKNLVYIEDRDKVINELIKLNKNNTHYDIEFRILRVNDRAQIHLSVKAELIYDKKNIPIKITGMIQDITKSVQQRIELEKAKEKAEESDKLKSAFLANMSHEIRTPMNAILGFSKLLANPNLSQNQKTEYQEYIINSGNNLLNLINDIIDVAKIEAGQILINKTNCAVNKILNELFATFEKQKTAIDKEHIKLILVREIDDEKFNIRTDPFRFRQIVANLLNNAFKFIESGSIEFGFRKKDNENLLFFVKDTGIGIPSDKMDLIFSRFGQIIGDKIRHPGGTGLGLSITKHLVEEMGGVISVDSQLNKGTTFFFTIPYTPIDVDSPEEIQSKSNKYDFSKLRILIVEDNPINATLLQDTLRMYSPEVKIDSVEDGKYAIEVLKHNEYDIIIMDIRMPILDGYQTTEIIRKQLNPPKNMIPIMGLSAHAMKEEREFSEKVGMNAFLTKPIIQEELIETIGILTGTKIEKTVIFPTDEVKSNKYQYLDLSLLENMYKGVKSKVNNILNLCLTNLPKQINDLRKFYNDKNIDLLRITAHSMKSTMNYLGVKKLNLLCKSIEDSAATRQNMDTVEQRIIEIETIWKKVVPEIEDTLKSND